MDRRNRSRYRWRSASLSSSPPVELKCIHWKASTLPDSASLLWAGPACGEMIQITARACWWPSSQWTDARDRFSVPALLLSGDTNEIVKIRDGLVSMERLSSCFNRRERFRLIIFVSRLRAQA